MMGANAKQVCERGDWKAGQDHILQCDYVRFYIRQTDLKLERGTLGIKSGEHWT